MKRPAQVLGFGTTFYGETDWRSDRSYVTTEWIIALFVPIFPLQSLRIRGYPVWTRGPFLTRLTGYRVVAELPIRWTQVFKVYAFTNLCIDWWAILIWSMFFMNWDWENYYLLLGFGYPVLGITPLLFPWAKRRVDKYDNLLMEEEPFETKDPPHPEEDGK